MTERCSKEECINDFNEYHIEGDDDFDYIHCEVENCHNQYYKNKNGWTCENCEKNICESCYCDSKNGSFIEDDEFYCIDCLNDLIEEEMVIKCQNKQKDCGNYIYSDNSSHHQCKKCKQLYCCDCCNDLFKSKKYKNICINCLNKLKK